MPNEEQELMTIVKDLEAAWNAGDGVRFASHFSEDAIFIHIFGGQLDGRAAIEQAHRQIFDSIYKGSHNEYTVQSVRLIRPDVALVHIRAHLKFSEGGVPREIHARPTIVAARGKNRWLAVAFQNTRIAEMPATIQALPHSQP